MKTQSIRVAVICTGNICRSPMAEVMLRHLIEDDALLRDRVHVTSAGTATWHVGSPMDPRARRALNRAGFDLEGSLAAYADRAYLDSHDVVVVMTNEHLEDVRERLGNEATEVILLRNLVQPGANLDVPDPYYGDDDEFDRCLNLLTGAGQHLTSVLRQRLDELSLEA